MMTILLLLLCLFSALPAFGLGCVLTWLACSVHVRCIESERDRYSERLGRLKFNLRQTYGNIERF